MTGHADLRLAPQALAGLLDRAVILPQMDAIGADPLGQADRIVDDEGDLALRADRLERSGEACGLVLVDALHAELERRD